MPVDAENDEKSALVKEDLDSSSDDEEEKCNDINVGESASLCHFCHLKSRAGWGREELKSKI